MEAIFGYLNVGLLITIVMLTYFVIGLYFANASQSKKRIITLILGAVISLIYYFILSTPLEEILPTFASAIVLYDYAVKYFLQKCKADYNNLSDEHGKL